MKNSEGWVKIHREIMQTPEWLAEPFTRGQAWVDLLLLANHAPGYIRKRGIMVHVERGMVGYSLKALSERWQWSEGKVIRFLTELTNLDRISRKTGTKTRVKNTSVSNLIYIKNYDKYQANSSENRSEDGVKTVVEQEEKEEKEIYMSIPFSEIQSLYHEILPELPGIRAMSDARKAALKARWNSGIINGNGTPINSIEYWTALFHYIRESGHLMGDNNRNWKANIDFIIKESSFLKIIEGAYH